MPPLSRDEITLIVWAVKVVRWSMSPLEYAGKVGVRFAFGLPVSGHPKTDATWWRAGHEPLEGMTPHGRWSYRPGWQRMLIRWSVTMALVASLVGWFRAPVLTVAVLVLVVAALVAWRVHVYRRDSENRRLAAEHAERVGPLFDVVAPYLGVVGEPAEHYLLVPRDIEADGARVMLTLPRGWDANEANQAKIDGVMRRLVHPRLVAEWEPMRRLATWRVEPLTPFVEQHVQPIYETLAPYLGLDPNDTGDRWIELPEDYEELDEVRVRVFLPVGVDIDGRKQQRVDAVVRRYLGRNLKSEWHPQEVIYTRKGTPPTMVKYGGQDDSVDVLKLGKDGAGNWVQTTLQDETPHGFVTAPTRYGKSTTLSVPAAHMRSKGALVGFADPKKTSYAKTFDRCPDVRVHKTKRSMAWGLQEFFLSMVGVEMAVSDGADINDFPPRLFVIDELGSLMYDLEATHKLRKSRKEIVGDAPFRMQFGEIAMRGGASRHFLAVGTHQPELSLFGGTMIRSQFGWKIILGHYDDSVWRTTFGNAGRLTWNGKKKGRGVIGFGQHADAITEAQITYMAPDEIIELTNSGPTPPDWWLRGEMAPWITDEVIAEAQESADLVDLSPRVPGRTGGGYTGSMRPDVRGASTAGGELLPPPPPPPPASEKVADQAVEMRLNIVKNDERTVRKSGEEIGVPTPGTEHKLNNDRARVVLRAVSHDDADLIVGNAAAAAFLGMTKETFERTRRKYKKVTGRPIPGEQVTAEGLPCWTQQALTQWQSSRPIAGARWAREQDREEGSEL